MTSIKGFRRGFGAKPGGTFNCSMCGRRTRLTVEGQTHLCGQCDEAAMIENGISDGNYEGADLEGAERRIAELRAKATALGGKFAALAA